jgi:hypothetical protein
VKVNELFALIAVIILAVSFFALGIGLTLAVAVLLDLAYWFVKPAFKRKR